MAEPHSGWICLHRQVKSHWLWPGVKGRRYSKFEAWIYLLLSANHGTRKVDIGSKFITIGRGQLLTSQVALAKKWKWHRETVLLFLYQLKADEMLGIDTSKHTSTGYTLLTISNYSKYQSGEEQASDIQPDIETDIRPASTQHRPYTNNNENNVNKKNIRSPSPGFTSGNGASEFTLAESFDAFWQAYPHKVDKEHAWKAWEKLKPTPELLNTILADIGRRIKTGEWQREEKKYILYPGKYLNGKRWEDEAETEEVEDPYANWPVSVDCQVCGDAHDQGETCPKMTT